MCIATTACPTNGVVGLPSYIADEVPQRDAVVESLKALVTSYSKEVQMDLLDMSDPLHGARESGMASFTGFRELPDSSWCEIWVVIRFGSSVQRLHGYIRFDGEPRVELWKQP